MDDLLYSSTGIDSTLDSISRTVNITNTIPPSVVNLLNSNQLVDWQFTIRETSGITDIDLTITILQQNSSYVLKQPLNRGGAWSYQGYGSVTVDAVAINAGTGTLQFSIKPLTSTIPYIMVAGQTTRQALPLAATYYPLDNLSNATPSGYAPPFTKFVSLKPSGSSSLRFVDGTGTVVWQSAMLIASDTFWEEIRIFPWLRMDIAPNGAAQFVTSLYYN